MNRTWLTHMLLAVIALLLGLNLFSGTSRTSYAATSTPVQYKVVSPGNFFENSPTRNNLENILTREGNDGWNLIMRYQTRSGAEVLIFKR
ncbi:MAG TPA: hypothetical protein VMB25_19690 [Bryobacteraceae bacterium]|nr:hypothetical protein [Bryobacteraceae bacterium]